MYFMISLQTPDNNFVDDGDDQDADEDDANLGQLLVVDVQVTTKVAGVTTCAR